MFYYRSHGTKITESSNAKFFENGDKVGVQSKEHSF